jgi:hypothetical protein
VGAGPAAVAIFAGAACRFATDGTVNLSTGAAANAAAVVDGFALKDAAIGEMVTLYDQVVIGYGPGASPAIIPGTSYFLSGTVAGGLADAASTGGTVPIARGVPDNSLTGTKEHKLRVFRSY